MLASWIDASIGLARAVLSDGSLLYADEYYVTEGSSYCYPEYEIKEQSENTLT